MHSVHRSRLGARRVPHPPDILRHLRANTVQVHGNICPYTHNQATTSTNRSDPTTPCTVSPLCWIQDPLPNRAITKLRISGLSITPIAALGRRGRRPTRCPTRGPRLRRCIMSRCPASVSAHLSCPIHALSMPYPCPILVLSRAPPSFRI
jgi:hypothetical protein